MKTLAVPALVLVFFTACPEDEEPSPPDPPAVDDPPTQVFRCTELQDPALSAWFCDPHSGAAGQGNTSTYQPTSSDPAHGAVHNDPS